MRNGIKGQIVSKILGMLDQADDTADEIARCERLADSQGRQIDRIGQQIGSLEVSRLEVQA